MPTPTPSRHRAYPTRPPSKATTNGTDRLSPGPAATAPGGAPQPRSWRRFVPTGRRFPRT